MTHQKDVRKHGNWMQSRLIALLCTTALWMGVATSTRAQSAPYAHTQVAGPVTITNATLNGMVVPNGLPTTVWFEWGTNSDFGNTTLAADIGAGATVVRVSAPIAGLSPMTLYLYRLVATNDLGTVYGASRLLVTGGIPKAWGGNNFGETNVPAGHAHVIALAAGSYHDLALGTDGQIVGWGLNSWGQTSVPAGLADVVAVGAGEAHSLALRVDGTVVAWGWNADKQTNVPTGLGGVVAVAGGARHNLALKDSGDVVAWGLNGDGQTNVPPGLSNVVAVAAGSYHSLALRADGSVFAWGRGGSGQTNVPASLSNVVSIAAGNDHSMALKADGTVVVWGANSSGQTNVPAGLSNVLSIAAGSAHCLALRANGSVVAWGWNALGQTNVPAALTAAAAVAGGPYHSVALSLPVGRGPRAFSQPAEPANTVGVVLSGAARPGWLPTTAWFEWGTNYEFGTATAPIEVGEDLLSAQVKAVITNLAAGESYQCRLVCTNALGAYTSWPQLFTAHGVALGWGTNSSGQLQMSPDWNDCVAISAGFAHTLTLNREGRVSAYGQLRQSASASVPAYVPAGLTNIVAIASGQDHCLAVSRDGRVTAWAGGGPYGSFGGFGQTNVPVWLSDVIAVAGGMFHSVALRSDGRVFVWGGTALLTNVPAAASDVAAIASGYDHILALRSDSTVVAWGSTAFGKCTVPAGLSNVVAVAAGSDHSMALKRDGSLVFWGGNSHGQTNAPAGLSNVVKIAAGQYNSMAVQRDGTVMVWGRSTYGQNGTFTNLGKVVAMAGGDKHTVVLRASTSAPPRAGVPFVKPISPTSVTFDAFATPNGMESSAWFEWGEAGGEYDQSTTSTNVGDSVHVVRVQSVVSGLAEGGRYQCRLVVSNELGTSHSWERRFTTGSKLTAWGYDYDGQGSTRVPAGLTNAVAMDGARGHVIVLRNDGTVLSWGLNDHGQTDVPGGLTDVVDVSASGWHSLALKQDGTVVAWGWNEYGATNVPSGLSNVMQVAAGGWHSSALRDDGTVVVWGGGFAPGNPAALVVPGGLADVIAISTSGDHMLALRNDGQVFHWGATWLMVSNYIPPSVSNIVAISAGMSHNLELDSSGAVRRWAWATAEPPADLTNAVAIAAGWYHSLALRYDGTVTAWTVDGYNTYGQTNVPPGLSNVVAVAAGELFSLALGSDVPPIALAMATNGYVNADLRINLPARDPNGDPITFRIATLPTAGTLYQFNAGVRGAAITAPDTAVNDSLGRVIFAPATDGVGTPYATFDYLVNDGLADSPTATVTVNIALPPAPSIASTNSGWSLSVEGAFELNFTGNSNAAYSAYASTNLIDWERLGAATQVSNGWFQFLDVGATNWPQRYYRAGAP